MIELFKSRLNLNYLKYNVSKYKGLMIFYTILFFTTFPIPLVIYWYTNRVVEPDFFNFMLNILLFFALVVSIITPIIVFNYVNSKSMIDVFHSLPIKRNDLFLTNFVTTILTVVIPYTFSFITGYLIYHLLGSEPGIIIGMQFYWYILVSLVVTTIPILFVIVNTGTVSDTIIYSCIILLAPFLAFGALQLFASDFVPGFSGMKIGSLGLLSPVFSAFITINGIPGIHDGSIYASYWSIVGLIMLSSTMIIYNRRKSEKSETPFVNNWFFPLIVSLFTSILLIFLISAFSSGSSMLSVQALSIPVLICLVIFLLLNMIKNRSLKNLRLILQNFVVLTCLTLLFALATNYTKGFGFTNYIPKSHDILEASINSEYDFYDYYDSSTPFFTGNSENIDNVREFHKDLVTRLNDGTLDYSTNPYLYEYKSVNLSYKLKSGRTIRRTFFIKDASINKIKALHLSMSNVPILQTNATNNRITDLKIFNNNFSTLYRLEGDPQEFVKVYREDLKSFSYDESLKNSYPLDYAVIVSDQHSTYSVNIDARFPRTKVFIEENSVLTPHNSLKFYSFESSDDPYPHLTGVSDVIPYYDKDVSELPSLSMNDLSKYQDKTLSFDLNTKNLGALIIEETTDHPFIYKLYFKK